MRTTKAEIRADGLLRIVGYVHVPGRDSRPVMTPRGKVIERIEQRAFERAIGKADNIDLMVDHERIIASTTKGNLTLKEDEVGLRAEAIIDDDEVIKGARAGKLRGWSFKMLRVVDEIEERAGQLPLRTIKDFMMPEVTLALHKIPVYSSTSIELRAEEEEEIEVRTEETQTEFIEKATKPKIDYSEYEDKILNLKGML